MNNMTYNEIKTLFCRLAYSCVATLAGNDICEFLNNSQMQQLIRNPPNDPPYDAVIIEVFGAQCFAIFGDILKVQ